MAKAKEKGIMLLSSTSVIIGTASNGTKLDLYTVPSGKDCIVDFVILRNPSATLSGCTDVNFGTGAGTTGTWLDNETGVFELNATTEYMKLIADDSTSNDLPIIDGDDTTAANREFGIYVVAGATGAAYTVTIDVFGYLF